MKKRILPPTLLLIALLLSLLFHFIFPLATIVNRPWNLLGLVPLGLGMAMNLAAERAFKARRTPVNSFEEPARLVTGGLYRLSRNPMYLGFVLVLLGVAILLGSLAPYIVIIGFVLWIDMAFIRIEERNLQKKFGADWNTYRARVRRWL